MLQTKKKTINGGEYSITQLAAEPDGMRVFRKLHKFLLPVIGSLADAHGGKARMADAATAMGELMADDEFYGLVQTMLQTCTYNGVELSRNPAHWDDHLEDLYEVVWLALEVNAARVFRGRLGQLGKLGQGVVEKLRSLQT